MDFFSTRSRITKVFSEFANLRETESHFVPENLSTHVNMSQLENLQDVV